MSELKKLESEIGQAFERGRLQQILLLRQKLMKDAINGSPIAMKDALNILHNQSLQILQIRQK